MPATAPAKAVFDSGEGLPLLCIHGTAADRGTWVMQHAVATFARLVAYDRAPNLTSVEACAQQARAVVKELGATKYVVCGSSFGAVVALELLLTDSDVQGAALLEPPLSCHPNTPSVPAGFGCAFEAVWAAKGAEAAAEFFLRGVLGGPAYDALPGPAKRRALGHGVQIRSDSLALLSYRLDWHRLRRMEKPVELVGGARSAPRFRVTLDALEDALPNVLRTEIEGAGHAMHAEAPKTVNARLRALVESA